MESPVFSSNKLQEDEANEAGADAIGDGVRGRHKQERQKSRDCFFVTVPWNMIDDVNHQESHQDQRWRRGLLRNDSSDGAKEHGRQE